MSYIPDLRASSLNDSITLEHCSVLLEKLRDVIAITEDSEDFGYIADNVDLDEMLSMFKEAYQPDEFNRLFKSDLGKGVLIGVYSQMLAESLEKGEEDETDYGF